MRVLYDYASETQFYWGNRETQLFFFTPLFVSDLAGKTAAPSYSTCIQPRSACRVVLAGFQ